MAKERCNKENRENKGKGNVEFGKEICPKAKEEKKEEKCCK
ncbi:MULTISPECIES: hypothetical protein [Sporomusa]|jgi:hypothetical protein|uniref:Uncharacterized protein n=2 Tax=Sporomusa TaxID=2375 RepID=A0ABP2CBS2_9FIRM|nr:MULTISPECIES: hypothetical protein [Sporomusa]OLS56257.1 hypothetical protein SPSPH_26480 [Sporomusa sphaeroides DSM 2875]CVK21747.1 hypothetical protein SSPH_04456 [Sporomusa sphaeroides DSM 2875]SCM82470.1 conserved hypothetical protein [uncultured Sporomusa sp.]HML33928.1 hypothetical protein [Sporomusa sphaeroides]